MKPLRINVTHTCGHKASYVPNPPMFWIDLIGQRAAEHMTATELRPELKAQPCEACKDGAK